MLNKKSAKISFAVMEPNTYMVAAVDEQSLVEYCVTMGERNRIPGLLPMHHQIVNGEYLLYFDITGKHRLKDVVGMERLSTQAGKKVLESLAHSLQGLSDYYLRPGMCMLDLDMLFVDDHYEPYLPLVPMTEDTGASDPAVREFLMVLLGECLIGDGSDPYFDQALKRLLPTTFRLEEFVKAMYPTQKAETPVYGGYTPPASPAVDYVPPKADPIAPIPPVPPAEEKGLKSGIKLPSLGKKKEEESAAPASPGFAIPGQNFAIPGQKDSEKKDPGKKIPVPGPVEDSGKKGKKDKKEKDKKKEEKSSGGLFGFIGKKKEAEAPAPIPVPRGDVYREEPARPAEKPVPRFDSSTGAPLNGNSASGGSWSGTVQLVNNGATVFMGGGAARKACIIHDGRRIELTSTPFTVGREACNYIIGSAKVSRTHMTVLEQDGVYYVKDENSSNHTYLNDVMLPPYTATPVRDGDTLRLGDVIVTLELPTE